MNQIKSAFVCGEDRRLPYFAEKAGMDMFMQNSENDTGHTVLTKAYEGSAAKEISADYNLPDYLPDINRLLKVSAKLAESSKYLSGDMLEYDGKVKFYIIYATSDGKIKSADFDADFSGNTAVSGASGDCDILFEPEIAGVSCRLQNPRKLTAKAKIDAAASVMCRTSTVPAVSGRLTSDEEAALQYRTRAIESLVEFDAEELATPVSEDIELDASMPAIEDIIAVELDPYISDMRAGENKVTYKGDIVASILYLAKTEQTGEEEMPAPAQYVAFARKVPISGEIAVQGVTEACVPIASVKTDNLEFRPQENSLGESRTVELDFDYSVFARIFCNEENEITTDMYSTDYESAEDTETLEYETVQYAKAFNFSADGSTPRDDTDFDEIVATTATASVEGVEKQGGKLVFTGNADVSVILTNGAGVYLSRSYTIPFRAQTDAGRIGDDFHYIANAFVMSAASRLYENNIYSDLEILITYAIFEKHAEEMIRQSNVYKDKPIAREASASLTLYYPTASDTLWDIAKKYGTTVPEIMAANGLSADTASGVLVIPKRGTGKPKYSKII